MSEHRRHALNLESMVRKTDFGLNRADNKRDKKARQKGDKYTFDFQLFTRVNSV